MCRGNKGGREGEKERENENGKQCVKKKEGKMGNVARFAAYLCGKLSSLSPFPPKKTRLFFVFETNFWVILYHTMKSRSANKKIIIIKWGFVLFFLPLSG